jgi:esterase/lipase
MRIIRIATVWIVSILLMLILTIYFVRAYDMRSQGELGPENRIRFEQEFDASREAETDWSAYLEIEDRLDAELHEKILDHARPDSLVDRYSADSLTYPGSFERNWNRSFEMTATTPRGVAVLLHGLSDSPYSMRPTAEILFDAGFSVVAPRMPGHGFAVGGLLHARWPDWAAAVRIAMRHAMTLPGSDEQLLLVGYSNGGLVAVDYALRCDDAPDLSCPDGLVLMSPAVAVTPLAAAANLHSAISWMPYFEKSKWELILPEVDPFKFTSFPMRGGWEIYKFSRRTNKALSDEAEVAGLPPILTFQSVVDSTVSAEAIVALLYNRLPANGSELVIYDVNRSSTVLHLIKNLPEDPARYFASEAPLRFDVTVLRNRNRGGPEVDAFTLAAGELVPVIEQTQLAWPSGIYSLSHIAVPFPADDEVYGNGSGKTGNVPRLAFGALAPRGELGVLRLTPSYFLRSRYNPFFEFQESRLREWIDAL